MCEIELLPEPYEGTSDVMLVDGITCRHDRGDVVIGVHDENEDVIYYICLGVAAAVRFYNRLGRRIEQASGCYDSNELH